LWNSLSADGRYVTFNSEATNLVPGDTNGKVDIFVHDRMTHTTTRVSVSSDGSEANGDSIRSSISTDGRFVVFSSEASNLVPDDTNGYWDIFVHDRQTGATTLRSVSSDGAQANYECWMESAVSTDGQTVAFFTGASNLLPGDTNGFGDIFVNEMIIASANAIPTVDGVKGVLFVVAILMAGSWILRWRGAGS
jgi:archaellum component FlaF (FlaF/FlaG flagellin family)